MKFSVVIPTYNRAHLIRKTIDSVLNQTYKDFEVIVVDDGSSDNTSEIFIREIYDERVFYYWKKNEERGVARNFGIQKASGDYVVFLDSDDTFHSNHLETLYHTIKRYQGINFLATKYNVVSETKGTSFPLKKIKQGWYGFDFFIDGGHLACNFCIRKNNKNLKYFLEDRKYSIMEDWIFILQNLENDKIFIIDKVTVSYFDHNERSMCDKSEVIISRRNNATEWILTNIHLTIEQKNRIIAYSDYFCSIHAYIDKKYFEALSYLSNATKRIGWRRLFLILKVKIFIKNLRSKI